MPLLFPQGFRISKNIGQPTLGSGCKKTFKRYLKTKHTDKQTDRWTFRLIESIGPEGRCFDKKSCNNCLHVVSVKSTLYPTRTRIEYVLCMKYFPGLNGCIYQLYLPPVNTVSATTQSKLHDCQTHNNLDPTGVP